MTRYWIAVACQEHVQRGIAEGFAQVCHGKPGPLKCMTGDDWIIYYSPTVHFGGKDPCRSFTAIGKVSSDEPYLLEISQNFTPWRRNVKFIASKEAPIVPLLERLTFIKNIKNWGLPFRRGCFEISQKDFQLIAQAMGIS